MKFISLLLFILSSLYSLSQENTNNKKISITPFAQYGSSYRILKGNYSINEDPLNTFGYGIRVAYNLKKLSVVSGIEYQQFGMQNKFSGLTFGDQIDPVLGFTSNSQESITAIFFQYKYNYLAIPLIIEYNIAKPSINCSFFAGAKANIFYSSNTKTIIEYENKKNKNSKSETIFDNKDLCLSSVYGILFHKKIGSQLTLKIGPTFDIFHQSIANSSPIERLPYKGSIFAGLTF